MWVVPVKPNVPFASVVRRCGGSAAAVATTVEGEGDVGAVSGGDGARLKKATMVMWCGLSWGGSGVAVAVVGGSREWGKVTWGIG
ncbi:hypothetical protein Tco_0686877 [Tanacetum coccineum]